MTKLFEKNNAEMHSLIEQWETRLQNLDNEIITKRYNSQNRNIKQILGHMIDSASNNTHRAIHLQYGKIPLQYPNYASNGNNERWIRLQNYHNEDWENLIQLWKYANYHIMHVFNNVDESKLDNVWMYNEEIEISLKEGALDYLRHFKLHLKEIEELIFKKKVEKYC